MSVENTIKNNKNNLKILFICIGNSCRSPMAESILKNMVKSQINLDWEIDSAALQTWNVGRSPEPRCLRILAEHGLSTDHIGRQISEEDFRKFDFIFGMDDYNIGDLMEIEPLNSTAKILLLGEYGSNKNDKIIFDPYFESGDHGFRRCYEQIKDCCKNFILTQLN